MIYRVKITQIREGYAELDAENPQAALAEADRLYNQEGRELPDMEDVGALRFIVKPQQEQSITPPTGPLTEEEAIAYMIRQGFPHANRSDAEWLLFDEGYRQECHTEAVRNDYSLYDVDRWYHLMDTVHADLSFRAAMFVDNGLWEEDLELMEVNNVQDILDTPEETVKRRLALLTDQYNHTGNIADNSWGVTPQDVASLIKALNLESELEIFIPSEESPHIEPDEPELPPEAKVYLCTGTLKQFLFEGPFETCMDFCKDQNWIWKDENEFVWDLELEDLREHDKSKDFTDAPKKQSLADKILDADSRGKAERVSEQPKMPPLPQR